MCALLSELAARGHLIRLRTFASGAETVRSLGFHTDAIDPRIEAIPHDDWKAPNLRMALTFAGRVFGRRALYEVGDLSDAVSRMRPDAMLVDVNCWGALAAADAGDVPWACFSPYTPPLRASGVPPFGPGLPPMPGMLGRLRDTSLRPLVAGMAERPWLPPINAARMALGIPQVSSLDEFLRRAPLLLVATGKPFEYPQTQWGDAVEMIGPCAFDPEPDTNPDWLESIELPIVLVTTSSERQADELLVTTAMAALADDPVHVIATFPAGLPADVASPPKATFVRYVPHGLVLDRAIAAVTHGGMGATQRALARGVPVCVVPFGRDQFEVARRVQVARCGTRLPASKLTAKRLRMSVHNAMAMTEGAARVAAGFEATGGVGRAADLFEQRLLSDTRQ
jgi:MGT family glycosyltransferase